jgi:hypothetical protein
MRIPFRCPGSRHELAAGQLAAIDIMRSMIFREWHEFITYPLDPDRVRTRAERLDLSDGFRRDNSGKYPEDYEPSSGRGLIIDLELIVYNGDKFECMEITDYGEVVIWTCQKVWLLNRKNTNGMEKLLYLPRHPPNNADIMSPGQAA